LEYIYEQSINASEIAVTLPGNLSQGNYKLRLTSSNPQNHSEASSTFSVSAAATPEITITSSAQEICENASVIFGASTQNAGSEKTYKWFVNNHLTASGGSPAFSTTTLQNGDVVRAELTCSNGCFFPATVVSNEISIRVKAKQTPYVELFASYYENPQSGDIIDFYAFAENGGEDITYEWYENGILVSGNEPYHSFSYATGKTVKVKVLCNADCLQSNVAEAEYTFEDEMGIEFLSISKLFIYPNPTKSTIKIKSGEIILAVEIIDLSGRTVSKYQFNSTNPEISMEHCSPGSYLLHITTANGRIVKKIMKL
jgi:hypothetical protein